MKSLKLKKDILNGNIAQQILLFTIPVCGSYLLQQLYQFADSIVLGRYAGVEAMAAVGGSATMIINVVLNFITGIATGVTIIVAHNYGRGDSQKVSDSVKTGMFVSIILGGLISIVGVVISKSLLIFTNCPAETINLSLIYIRCYFASIIPYTIYVFGNNILHAIGETKISIVFTIIIAVVKIILDIVLTVIFNVGVWGVSISTSASYLICGIVVLIILYRTPESYHFDIREFGFDKTILIKILKIGIPVAIQSAVFAITNVFVSVKINEFGTNTIAAFSSYNNVDNFYWSFTNAIGVAIITITGQNFGNKNNKRVKDTLKYGILIHSIASIVLGGLELLLGKYIFGIFTTNKEVIGISFNMLKIVATTYLTYVLVEMISGSLKGMGDSVHSMIIAIIGICVVRISYLMFFNITTPYQVIYCYPISWSITSIIYLIYYLINKNKLTQNN